MNAKETEREWGELKLTAFTDEIEKRTMDINPILLGSQLLTLLAEPMKLTALHTIYTAS